MVKHERTFSGPQWGVSASVVDVFVRNNTTLSTTKKQFAFTDDSYVHIRRGKYLLHTL
jgi:predicted deacetylase